MPIEFRIISIGTLDAHPLWDESRAVRTGHATTTLVTAGDARILVDPSLPTPALLARLGERSHVAVADITHVFLTAADRLHRRALGAFSNAKWLVHEPELTAARSALNEQIRAARETGDAEVLAMLEGESDQLRKCRAAPDRIVSGVDLFPMPGVTPGLCGLLLSLPRSTVLIAGDAVATIEHMEQGKVLSSARDVEQARASFREAIEIADIIVPGRDNYIANPMRRMF